MTGQAVTSGTYAASNTSPLHGRGSALATTAFSAAGVVRSNGG